MPETQTLTFRCPAALEGRLPPPTPAAAGLPDWLRAMPKTAFNPLVGGEDDTVKRCPPFVDAMTAGVLIPLACDVRVADGQFTWDFDLPPDDGAGFPRAPMGFHDPTQVAATPLAADDRFLVKFHNLWTIEAPAGWSLLFTHPINRFDLPFTTLTGLVDCDRYRDAWINFPARWRDPAFEGVLAKGTPIAQCIPVRRDRWAIETAVFTEDDAARTRDVLRDIRRERGVYRRRYRA